MKQYVQQTIKLGTASVLGVVVAIQMGCSSATSKQSEEITVYTAVEADQLKQYQEELHKAYPELKVKWVRDSTGVITAKLWQSRKIHKRMWFWGGFNQFAGHGKKDMLEPFKPEGVQNLKSEFVSQNLYQRGRVWMHGNLQFVSIKSN